MNSFENDDPQLSQIYNNSGNMFSSLFGEIGKVIVGQKESVEQIVIAILCNGHALVESNPGLGKTLTISTISKTMDLSFSRIQCTPDLMPADITGTHFVEEIGGTKNSSSNPVQSLLILFWQMKSIVHPQKPSPHFLKQCRKNR